MVSIAVYMLAAVGPAAALVFYICKKDGVEKEPTRLLLKLVAFGALSAVAAMVLEGVADPIVQAAYDPVYEPFGYAVAEAFFGVALMEELAKYLFLKWGSWRSPEFNYRFDGIVYAVCVSLGFAALENIIYVVGFGLEIAPYRAVLSIPGHMSFGVVMGYFYSRARHWSNWGNGRLSRLDRFLGVLMATLMHGFYDCCLTLESDLAIVVFILFVAALFIAVFSLVKRESRRDEPIVR